MYRRIRHFQGAYANVVKTYSHKIVLQYSCVSNVQFLVTILFVVFNFDVFRR